MNTFPEETFGVIGQFLTIRDILSLAITNLELQKTLLTPNINRHLANHFGFPYELTFAELQRYENMSRNDRLREATNIGDRRIIDKMIELGADNLNEVLVMAANHGNLDLVKLFIQKGANTLSMAMISAAKFNHHDIIEFLFEQGSKSLKRSADIAAQYGSIDALKKLFELDAKIRGNVSTRIDSDSVMAQAVKGNQIEIVEWLIEEGKSTPNYGLLFAVRFDRMEIAKIAVQYGANNIASSIDEAYKYGHIDIAEYLENLIEENN